MKKVFALAAVAGIASVANAAAVLDVKVSSDGGATWSDSVDANTGSTVLVRFIASFDNAYGWASTVSDLTGGGLAAGDSVNLGSRAGVFTGPGGAANAPALFTSGGNFRIGRSGDAGNNPGDGLTHGQAAPTLNGNPNALFDASNPALLYTYSINIGAIFGRSISLSVEPLVRAGRSGYNVYTASGSTVSSATTGSVDGAVINVVPAPGAVALLGLAGLVAGRRRR
jgi:MYXO-CTERM domain-containing protein